MHFESYIIHGEEVGEQFSQALIAKAGEERYTPELAQVSDGPVVGHRA